MRYRLRNKKRFGWGKRVALMVILVCFVTGIVQFAIKPATVQAAISYVASATALGGTSSGTLVINKPTGTTVDDVMVAQIMALPGSSNSVTITPPAGWSLAGTSVTSNKYRLAIYYKVATAGDSGTSNYTFSFSPNSTKAGGITSYTGVDTINPIDKYATQVNGSGTSHVAPSVTASFASDWVIPFWGIMGSVATDTIDAQLTALWQTSTTNNGISAGHVALNNAGATGTYTATTPSAVGSLAATVALKPASASVGVQYKSVSTNTSCLVTCTSLAHTVPGGTVAGDFLIASVTWNTAVAETAPAGWTQISTTQSTGNFRLANYYRFVQTGDATSYTWNFGGAGTALALINMVRFSGVDPDNPIDVSAQANSTSGTSHDAPSVTTTTAQIMLFDIWSWNTGTVSDSMTSSMTEIWDNQTGNASTNNSTAAGYEKIANSGATGTRNVVSGRNAIAMMHSIAIRPDLPDPTLLGPDDGTVGTSLSPQFSLVSATLSGGNQHYRIQLCSTSNCSSVITTYNQTVSQTGWSGQDAVGGTAYTGGTNESLATAGTYTVQTPLTPGTQYWWRGISYDLDITSTSNYSQIYSFTTSSIPSAPTLLYPANNLTGTTLFPELKLATTDADNDDLKYRIHLCSTNTCSTIIATYDQTVSQTGWSGQTGTTASFYSSDSASISNSAKAYFTLPSQLTPTTQYWWRAYAIDPGGTNTWSSASSIFSFTTNTNETRILEGRIMGGRIL